MNPTCFQAELSFFVINLFHNDALPLYVINGGDTSQLGIKFGSGSTSRGDRDSCLRVLVKKRNILMIQQSVLI